MGANKTKRPPDWGRKISASLKVHYAKAASSRKGKTYEEIFGKEKSDAWKASQAQSVSESWARDPEGKKKRSKKHSRNMKRRWKNPTNAMAEYIDGHSERMKTRWKNPTEKQLAANKKISAAVRRRAKHPTKAMREGRKKQSKTMKKKWEHPSLAMLAHISKLISKVSQKPNKFEMVCGVCLEAQFPGKFTYCGDGSLLINKRSPDFICEAIATVVLCNGLYWHLVKRGIKDTPANRRKVELKESEPFRKAGYDVWFIWEGDEEMIRMISKEMGK